MENMEDQASFSAPPPRNGPQPNQKKNKRKQLQHAGEIVFTKGSSIHTMPCLSKLLKGATDCIVGLQYVWEYRSPSKSVPPHYQCKLCGVSRLQHDMVAHVKGWKHSFKYLSKAHPDKVTCTEEDGVKDPAVRKVVKEAAAEVEKVEGRGQLKVILKEPCEVLAFKGLRTAIPKIAPPPPPGVGHQGPPPPPFGPKFSGQRFPPQGGLLEHPVGEPGFGGYSSGKDFFSPGMNQRPSMGPTGDGYRRSGLLESPGRMYPDEYRDGHLGGSLMDKPVDKPPQRPGLMGAAPENSSLPNTLLSYLDTFRIQNEDDAQLVLKVTQKLTDVLMEYRLRSVSSGSTLNSFSMGSSSFSNTPSRLPGSDRYSSSLSGMRAPGLQAPYPSPKRFPDGPSRFYK